VVSIAGSIPLVRVITTPPHLFAAVPSPKEVSVSSSSSGLATRLHSSPARWILPIRPRLLQFLNVPFPQAWHDIDIMRISAFDKAIVLQQRIVRSCPVAYPHLLPLRQSSGGGRCGRVETIHIGKILKRDIALTPHPYVIGHVDNRTNHIPLCLEQLWHHKITQHGTTKTPTPPRSRLARPFQD